MKSYSIGRGEENDIVIFDDSVSRKHAELVDEGKGGYRLRDVGSVNGTFARSPDNDWKPSSFAALEADDPVRIGRYETSIGALLDMIGVRPRRKPKDASTVTRR